MIYFLFLNTINWNRNTVLLFHLACNKVQSAKFNEIDTCEYMCVSLMHLCEVKIQTSSNK